MNTFTDAELAAFLDEALPAARCSELEHELRSDTQLRQRLIEVRGRETAGLHTLGAIWRRNRLSCPTRNELGQHILGTLAPEASDYVRFHLTTIGCRYCQANLADLESASKIDDQPKQRRQKYFQTSAGYLKKSQ
tara:strand:+ start:17769 stop:18173 length:405 start_codon:yes stop_codon:yes gene_type:complete